MTEEPPVMFRRPSDPPEPLPPLRSSQHIVRLHTEWARQHAEPVDTTSTSDRLRAKARSVVSRVVGTTDRQLLGEIVRAVDAVAARCDELSERLANLELTSDDLARTLGQEITQLRAAVEHGTASGSGAGTPPTR